MKKLIRAILKLPLTPFVLLVALYIIMVGIVIMIMEWVYEDKSLRQSTWVLHEAMRLLKKWFTTI